MWSMSKHRNKVIDVSIVSHGHNKFVNKLLYDLILFEEIRHIFITVNVPENPINIPKEIKHKTSLIINQFVKGFGENHNFALRHSCAKYFCVLNPDITFEENPFPSIIDSFDFEVAICTSKVLDPDRNLQDNAREFPNITQIFYRFFKLIKKNKNSKSLVKFPDWVAGMFMVIKSDDFKQVKGFDEKFFLYVEDADLCWRLKKIGKKVKLDHNTYCIHDARRDSHKSIKFFILHLMSLFRFWSKYYFNKDITD